MVLYRIAAIATEIYQGLLSVETEACRKEWKYSLYYAIARLLNHINPNLVWEDDYAQWNINHLFRGHENTLNQKHADLRVVIISVENTGRGVFISGAIEEPGRENEGFQFELTPDHFLPLETVHDNGRRILLRNERFTLIDSVLELDVRAEVVAEQSDVLPEKVRCLTTLLEPVRNVYAASNDAEKNFIETIIGASIFYLPHPVNECFSGYCSLRALNEKIAGRRIVKEHIIPRKFAARQVLSEGYGLNGFFQDFTNRFRRFMYLTPEENKMTVNYTEETHDEALVNLGIVKFPAGASPFVNNHTLFMNFIAFCKTLRQEQRDFDLDAATAMLIDFKNANNL